MTTVRSSCTESKEALVVLEAVEWVQSVDSCVDVAFVPAEQLSSSGFFLGNQI